MTKQEEEFSLFYEQTSFIQGTSKSVLYYVYKTACEIKDIEISKLKETIKDLEDRVGSRDG